MKYGTVNIEVALCETVRQLQITVAMDNKWQHFLSGHGCNKKLAFDDFLQ